MSERYWKKAFASDLKEASSKSSPSGRRNQRTYFFLSGHWTWDVEHLESAVERFRFFGFCSPGSGGLVTREIIAGLRRTEQD